MSPRKRPDSRSWGEEWMHLAEESGLEKKSVSTSDSAISLSYETSSGASESTSTSDRSSNVSVPRRVVVTRRSVHQRRMSRAVTPSSSISNLSRRSPLSSVRSADCPHILVRPELRYCPPQIPPPHGWNSSRTSSISQLIPVADIQSLQSRPSSTSENLVIRGPRKTLPALPRNGPPLTRRKTSDLKVPGAYVNDQASFNYEENLDECVRKIEVEYVKRSPSRRNQHPSTIGKRQPGNFERLSPPPTRVDTKARYREKRPVSVSPSKSKPVAKIRPGTAHPAGSGRVENVTVKEFRRLSLGDISLGLGSLAGLGKMFD
ncbi:hypothetical protein ONS96_000777 [Cadophora gregata f. sp. sojae]|nr:hypothetical protein ONS96_000777 [Cadophora gregata f. sp. sojae]